MADQSKLLVVDDEQVVCQVCRRIFSRQGFEVETCTDARDGLEWATRNDYRLILLDIKMPNMDGIEFLEQLRQKKPEMPVLIITGYPSIPNAAAAMRLGACDYVTKPFTSEEITQAVQRVLAMYAVGPQAPEAAEGEAPRGEAPSEVLFFDESWFRIEADGSACAGVVLSGLEGAAITGVRLPRIGEVVYQGLPLCGVTVAGKGLLAVAAPVSGVVVAVNEQLPQNADWLRADPCGNGWIACICTTHYELETERCKPRRVLLVNADAASAGRQRERLVRLGCQVAGAAGREELVAALPASGDQAIFLDAASFGAAGPELAAVVNKQAPAARVVVLAPPGDAAETTYRKEKIFYYAVEPLSDDEQADVLSAVFHAPEKRPPVAERHRGPSEPISSIAITNRNAHKVQLMSAPGLLWRNEGLGSQIGERLLAKMLPVAVAPGEANLTPGNILKVATACDRLMVLVARDSGALPGSLARNTKPDFDIDPGEAAGKVTILTVQPDAMGGLAGLSERTTAALANHIVLEMASY